MTMKFSGRSIALLLILLVILSGLYIFSNVVGPYEQDPVISANENFNALIPTEIVSGDKSKNQVIFTFDAGSGTLSVIPIINALRKHRVKGTFFITGKWILQNPQLTKQILADGHEIFNHSYSHPHLTELTDGQVKSELMNMEKVFYDLTGTSTKPYFRPPYGDRNDNVLKQAAQIGYRSVYWTLDALDWKDNDGMTTEQAKIRILSNLKPGAIFLMHVGDSITGNILDEIFTEIEKRGYNVVSLTQGL